MEDKVQKIRRAAAIANNILRYLRERYRIDLFKEIHLSVLLGLRRIEIAYLKMIVRERILKVCYEDRFYTVILRREEIPDIKPGEVVLQPGRSYDIWSGFKSHFATILKEGVLAWGEFSSEASEVPGGQFLLISYDFLGRFDLFKERGGEVVMVRMFEIPPKSGFKFISTLPSLFWGERLGSLV